MGVQRLKLGVNRISQKEKSQWELQYVLDWMLIYYMTYDKPFELKKCFEWAQKITSMKRQYQYFDVSSQSPCAIQDNTHQDSEKIISLLHGSDGSISYTLASKDGPTCWAICAESQAKYFLLYNIYTQSQLTRLLLPKLILMLKKE